MAKHRVLIVDDQRDIRFVLRAGLETLLGDDVQVTDVPSGEEAILVISRHPIDLLISDIRLPGISGLELKEKTLIRNPGLKVILMTGMPEPGTRREVEKAGADAYFFKPFLMPEFMATVQACLGLTINGETPAAVEISEGQPSLTMADRLSSLHEELGAVTVILLNDDGQIVAETRQQPEFAEETPMINALATLFSAALKLGYMMGADARDWMFFDGKDYDLALTHVGAAFGLLVVLPNSTLEDRQMARLLAALRAAARDLSTILDHMGVAVQVEAPAQEDATAPEPEAEEIDTSEVLPELDAIFSQAPKEIKPQDVDSFWEELSDAGEEDVRRAGAISYEQARQLGLAPEE